MANFIDKNKYKNEIAHLIEKFIEQSQCSIASLTKIADECTDNLKKTEKEKALAELHIQVAKAQEGIHRLETVVNRCRGNDTNIVPFVQHDRE